VDHVWLASDEFCLPLAADWNSQQVPFALERCLLPSIHFVVLASTVKVSRPFLFSTIHSTAIIATQNLCLALIDLTPQHPRYVRAAYQSGWETIATRTPQHQSLSRTGTASRTVVQRCKPCVVSTNVNTWQRQTTVHNTYTVQYPYRYNSRTRNRCVRDDFN